MGKSEIRHTIRIYEDERTGRSVRQLTSLPGNHHHLYFTSTSFTADNAHALYLSDPGDGSPNIYKLSLQDGHSVRLTNNGGGFMRSYVYYDGVPYDGLAKASPSFSPAAGRLAYIQGRDVLLADVENMETETIYRLPPDVMTGFTHISADGRYVCVPYIPSAAFEVGPGNPFPLIRDKVHGEGIESRVLVIDAETGRGEVRFAQVGWITHVQFHPNDPETILYNHEGGAVDQRIWLYRDGRIEKVRDQSTHTSGRLWICHEMWTRDGERILYHGTRGVPSDPALSETAGKDSVVSFVGCADPASGAYREVDFPASMSAYGHFTESGDRGRLVTDGVVDAHSLHLCEVDWEAGRLEYRRLCMHGSSFSVQDVHPHPIFSHDSRLVLFTSDAHNERTRGHLYLIEI